MCLAIPGMICSTSGEGLMREGLVRFGQVERTVNLAFTPEARVGDYVIVHVGCAISVLDESEAESLLVSLESIGVVEDEIPG